MRPEIEDVVKNLEEANRLLSKNEDSYFNLPSLIKTLKDYLGYRNFNNKSVELPKIYSACAHPQSVWFEEHWRPVFDHQQALLEYSQKRCKELERLGELIVHCFEMHDYPELEAKPYVEQLKVALSQNMEKK